MRKLLHLPLFLALVGCIEYEIPPRPEHQYIVNPRPAKPIYQTDTILQVVQPEVDVLWVIDNSCSMSTYQQKLADNFPVFFEFFDGSGMDYHIGVVSTDMDGGPDSDGKLISRRGLRWIEPQTNDAANLFKEMSILGSNGSATEKGNDATYHALEVQKNDYNLGFLRDNSSIHTILVSDEADYSTEITSDELGAFLNGLRQEPDDVTYSSIVRSNDFDYKSVTNLVGGIVWDIDTQDWTQLLEQLGLQAAGLKVEYFLSQLPVLGTITVTVKENNITLSFIEGEDWEYNSIRNSISFYDYVPNPMAEVIIKYEILASSEE